MVERYYVYDRYHFYNDFLSRNFFTFIDCFIRRRLCERLNWFDFWHTYDNFVNTVVENLWKYKVFILNFDFGKWLSILPTLIIEIRSGVKTITSKVKIILNLSLFSAILFVDTNGYVSGNFFTSNSVIIRLEQGCKQRRPKIEPDDFTLTL